MKRSLMFYFIIIITLLNVYLSTAIQISDEKDFVLTTFRYDPTDLKVRVFPETPGGDDAAEVTDFSIIRVENGLVNAFLVRSFKSERGLVDYSYRVVFYKENNLSTGKIDLPVYSFVIRFEEETCIVKYEPLRGVPNQIRDNNYEMVFQKDRLANVFYIKDYDGQDFLLSDRIRPIVFSGRIRDNLGAVREFGPGYTKMIRLIKVDPNSSEEIRGAFRVSVDIPLNEVVYIGLSPYEIVDVSSNERFKLSKLIVNGLEASTFLIHFAEVWDNIYKQELIFVDEGYHLDIVYDKNSYDIRYSFDGGEYSASNTSPLTIPIKENINKRLSIRLSAKNYSVNYLQSPVNEITLDISDVLTASMHANDVVNRYPTFTRVREDGALEILPNFKKTTFAIFTGGHRASVRVKKLEPFTIYDQTGFIDMGEAPIFVKSFNYGRYLFSVEYYRSGATESDPAIRVVEEKIVEFSDSTNNRFASNIKFLTRNDMRIPYIEFFTEDAGTPVEQEELLTGQSGTIDNNSVNNTVNTDTQSAVSNDIVLNIADTTDDAVVSDNNTTTDTTTDITTVQADISNNSQNNTTAEVVSNRNTNSVTATNSVTNTADLSVAVSPVSTLRSISNQKRSGFYTIQINAFEKGVYSESAVIEFRNKYLENYRAFYNRACPYTPLIAEKRVAGKDYFVLILGPFNRTNAFRVVNDIRRMTFDAFVEYEASYGDRFYE